MPHKNNRPFLRIRKCFQDVDPGIGGVHQQDIMAALSDTGGLTGAVESNKGHDLQGKFRVGGELIEFAIDALGFLVDVLLGVKAAPGAPTGLWPGLKEPAGQDGLNFQRQRRWGGKTCRLGKIHVRQGERAQGQTTGGGADAGDKFPAV